MRGKVTYEEIARESGISLATISRVVNKSSSVTEKTRQKVIAAMQKSGINTEELDLAPVPGRNMIIFNVPTLHNPFYSYISIAAREAAERRGYSLLVNESPVTDETIDSFISLVKKTKAAGVICVSSTTRENLVKLSAEIPTVCCCETVEDSPVPFVTIDDEIAAENAVRHLISIGKRRIAMINGPAAFKYAKGRLKGYKNALARNGIEIDKELIAEVGADMNYDQAKGLCLHMLSGNNPPDAFFCISADLAAGAVRDALESGKSVPADLAVAGYDDIIVSRITNPTITTVRQPTAQIGLIATEMLIKLIEEAEITEKSLYLGTELVIRESTTIR